MKKRIKSPVFFVFTVCLFISLAGCSSLFGVNSSNTDTLDATPTVITLPTQLSVQTRVESQTCQVVEQVTIQTDDKQGNLLAWSPNGDQLAFVQPVNQYSGWYIGDIVIYDVLKDEVVFTSKDQAVFGDLTWSPDGSELAYVELDQDAGIYTVKTVDVASGVSVDAFGDLETATTDDYASKKGILSWDSYANLIVTSVCGTDCVRLYQYNAVSQTINAQEEIRYNENTSLDLTAEVTSPDGAWLLTTDEKENTWLSRSSANRVSLLTELTIEETKFSGDSKYLAVRTAEQVLIFKLGCSEN